MAIQNYYWSGLNLLVPLAEEGSEPPTYADLIEEYETDSDTSQKATANLQVLEKDPHLFSIGVKVPSALVEKWVEKLPAEIRETLQRIKHPHLSFTLPSPFIHPSILVKKSETLFNSHEVTFCIFVITKKGSVNMLAVKPQEHQQWTALLARAHDVFPTNYYPQTRLGKLDQKTTEDLFKNPEKYGFTYEETRQILIMTPEEQASLEINFSDLRPVEQDLLALSYGEHVTYAPSPLERCFKTERKFNERNELILQEQARVIDLFAQGMIPKCPTYKDPVRFSPKALDLSIHGDPSEGRIPLIFTMTAATPHEGIYKWVEFRRETSRILVHYGYDDAHVSVLGSGVTGYSGNPHKPLKAWTPNSDVDCAIFSTKLATKMLENQGWVNTKVTMAGKYIVFKNSGNTQLNKSGFHHLPIGQALETHSRKWTRILYGEPGTEKPKIPGRPVEVIAEDEVDFKLNIEDVPFERFDAITFQVKDHAQKIQSRL